MEDTKFRRWLHSQSHFFLNGVLSPCWQLFTTLSNGFWWSVIVSLLFYLPALTTFNFFSLTFLLHFTHLLFDLYFAFSGALSISIWPSTAISICNFSILNCLPLFISSLTIPLTTLYPEWERELGVLISLDIGLLGGGEKVLNFDYGDTYTTL